MFDVKKYTPGDPVGEGEVPVRATFSLLDAVRVEMTPVDDSLEPAVYVVFRRLSTNENDAFKEIREATGARTNNLWYRILDGGMQMETEELAVRLLEQALQVMEDEAKH